MYCLCCPIDCVCPVGGGDVKIESQKVNNKDQAKSKVGSMDNLCHEPGGGNIKVRSLDKRPSH